MKIRVTALHDDDLAMVFEYDPDLVRVAQSVPGAKWSATRHAWLVPVNALVRDRVLSAPDLFVCDEAARARLELAEDLSLPPKDGGPACPRSNGWFVRAPFPHQRSAFERLRHVPRFLLADDMGLGKTKVLIDLIRDRGVRFGLVVCPLSAFYAWEDEWRTNTDGTKDPQLLPFRGTAAKRAKILDHAVDQVRIGRPTFLLTNYETMRVEAKGLRCCGFRAIVFDECHAVKEPRSKRTKVALDLIEGASSVFFASGTPAPNSPLDLFVPLQACGGFWRSRWEFESRYAEKKEQWAYGRSFLRIVGTRNLEELGRARAAVSIARTKEDVLDLPPKIRTFIEFDLSAKERKAYEAMRKECLYAWRELDPSVAFESVASSVMEQVHRLMEITSGYLRRRWSDGEERVEKIDGVSSKEAIAFELADGKPTVYFVSYRPTGASLVAALCAAKRRVGRVTGEETQDRSEILSSFSNGLLDDLVVNLRCAEGFTATRSQHAIFLERSWTPAVNLQAEDRLHRIGQTGTVTVHVLRAKDTIEERLDAVLNAKEKAIGLTLGEVARSL